MGVDDATDGKTAGTMVTEGYPWEQYSEQRVNALLGYSLAQT